MLVFSSKGSRRTASKSQPLGGKSARVQSEQTNEQADEGPMPQIDKPNRLLSDSGLRRWVINTFD